ALVSNSYSLPPPNSLSFRRLSEAREEESSVWQIPKIVTAGFIPHITQASSRYSVEYRVILIVRKNKTAPIPPAVRAPVFPHAFPVTEGLKSAIPPDVSPGYLSLV